MVSPLELLQRNHWVDSPQISESEVGPILLNEYYNWVMTEVENLNLYLQTASLGTLSYTQHLKEEGFNMDAPEQLVFLKKGKGSYI